MPTCETCRFFDTTGFEKSDGKEGYCHRNPPVALLIVETITTTFPRVPGHFWCGEWTTRHKSKDR